MTDTEFKALRPGDKVSVSGKQIAFNVAKCRSRSSRLITGQTIWTMCTKPIAWYRTTEQNLPALSREWISEGGGRWS